MERQYRYNPKRLREARMGLGLSIYAVAERLGVAHTTVLRWETGARAGGDRQQLADLCAVLGLSPGEVFEEVES